MDMSSLYKCDLSFGEGMWLKLEKFLKSLTEAPRTNIKAIKALFQREKTYLTILYYASVWSFNVKHCGQLQMCYRDKID